MKSPLVWDSIPGERFLVNLCLTVLNYRDFLKIDGEIVQFQAGIA